MVEDIKKIELHLHLDGSISLELASKLSGLSILEVKDKMVARDKTSLNEYLTKFSFPISLMQTKKNLELVAKNLIKQLEKDNVLYAEIRFAPIFHTYNGLSLDDVITSVLNGLQNEKVKTNLIICLMKSSSYEENLKVIEISSKYLNKGVVAFDFAGDEKKYPITNFIELIKLIKSKNIPLTYHAGEVTNNDLDTLINLGIKRIGHGVKSIYDNEILTRIKKNNILLEICPTSNIQTNAFDNIKNHPVYTFFKNKINLSINTDNRTVSNITLNKEYKKLMNNFSFTILDLKKININAVNYTFLSAKEKIELLEKLK